MNLKRAIGGPLLSIVFLIFFIYAIAGLQGILDGLLHPARSIFLSSVSGNSQNLVAENAAANIADTAASMPEINAQSALSVESNLRNFSRIIFGKNGDSQLPIASLTKLMTAIVSLDTYKLSDIIVVSESADSQNPMKQDVKLGDTRSVGSFLEIMLVGSSNRSAYALSEGPGGHPGAQNFVALMNKKVKDIGLQNTFFADPTGLSSKNISTANDIIKLSEYILENYPVIAEITTITSIYVPGLGEVKNTNQLLDKIPASVFSKTGFTNEASGCLLLVLRNQNNNYLINVILGADDRFAEMEKLVAGYIK